ncbi:MAG: hypothetical protein GX946_11575 [Oligosphaeraceae bacterium]|nr:hypothetical protein [Oligosphaeraceae bacterium]
MSNISRASLAKPAKLSVNMSDCFSDFATWLVLVALLVGAVVWGGFLVINKNQEIKNLQKEVLRIAGENSALDKQLHYRRAELESQKNSKRIVVQAEKMGLRPARGQQVEHLRIVRETNLRHDNSYLSMLR